MVIFKAMSFLNLLLCFFMSGKDGVIRHGIDKNESLKLALQDEYNCVGKFTQNGRLMGSCVLIHPQIALTAAHTLIKIKNADIPLEMELLSHRILIDSFKIHPWYQTNKGADIALLYLSHSITDVRLPVLNKSKKEKGKLGTSVGYGNFSVANNPREITDAGRIKSAGQNMIDSVAGDKLPNKMQPFLFADFDHPESEKSNKSGESKALPLEFGLDGGDSGGGMFIANTRRHVLAGINAIQNKNIADIIRTGTFYGSSSEWVRISAFRKWIKKEINIFGKK